MNIEGLEIEVERKAIKNVHLSVYPPDGRVHISVPNDSSDKDIRFFIIDKWNWIEEQRRKIAEQPRQNEREYVNGETHYLFGQHYRLLIEEITTGQHEVFIRSNRLVMRIRKDTSAANRGALLFEFYRQQLSTQLKHIVEDWCRKLGEDSCSWQIKLMKARWGSCNDTKRSILFNLLLARVPVECIEYVVVHEITHFKAHNHDALFAKLMNERLPHWRAIRQKLNSFIALPL